MVWHTAAGDHVDQMVAGPAQPAAEAGVEMTNEVGRAHLVEELVPHPVRLDDARVERIGDAVRACDEAQIRPRAVEGPRQLGEAAVRLAGVAVLEERPRAVRAAETERVRRVRVAGEEQCARYVAHAATRPGARRPSARKATMPVPEATSAVPGRSTCVPSAAPESRAVITAPNTSTAVTST